MVHGFEAQGSAGFRNERAQGMQEAQALKKSLETRCSARLHRN